MIDFSVQPMATTTVGSKAPTGEHNPSSIEKRSFGDWLDQSIQTVSRMQEVADDSATKLTTGESKDIHNTMITMQKAEIAMNLTMEVRNKIMSAYDEIKRMQL